MISLALYSLFPSFLGYKKSSSQEILFHEKSKAMVINFTPVKIGSTQNIRSLLVTLCGFGLDPLKKWQEQNKSHVNLPVEKHQGRNS